eukprot:178281_1
MNKNQYHIQIYYYQNIINQIIINYIHIVNLKSQMSAGSNISNSTLTATSNTHTNAMINANTNTITNTQSLSILVATNTTETIDTLDDTIESIETSGGEKEFEE